MKIVEEQGDSSAQEKYKVSDGSIAVSTIAYSVRSINVTVNRNLLPMSTEVNMVSETVPTLTTVRLQNNEKLLPKVTVGEVLSYKKITAQEKFTRPSARYTEAGLVRKLEEDKEVQEAGEVEEAKEKIKKKVSRKISEELQEKEKDEK